MDDQKVKDIEKELDSTLKMQLNNIRRYLFLNADIEISGKACLMVGAGFSKNADRDIDTSMKDWMELGKVFYRKLYGQEPTDRDLIYNSPIKLASMIEASFGRAILDKLIQDSLPDGRVYPNYLYREMLNLPWHDIFTTNYDSLLERTWSVDGAKRHYNLVTNKETLIYTQSPRIIKLHGSFPNIHPYIITEEDYRTYPKEYPEFVNTVRQALIENLFCLIGFSGDDPNFLSWIGWLRDVMGRLSMPVYLITYNKNIHDAQIHLLKSRNIEVVNLARIPQVNNYRDAFDFLFTYLNEDAQDEEGWNCHLEYKLDNNSDAIDTIKKASAIRKSYKGWMALPEEYYDYFQEESENYDIGKFISQCNDEELKLNLLYEFDWRLNISNTPKDFNWYISYLEKISLANEDSNETIQKKLWLLISLLKVYRHKSETEKYTKLSNKLLELIGDMSDSLVSRYYKETCLHYLERLDYNKVLPILNQWNLTRFDFKNRIFKATILSEIGKQNDAVADLEDIRKQIKSQKLSSNFATSPFLDSCLQQVYGLLHFMEFGFYTKVEKREKPEQIIGYTSFVNELQKKGKKPFVRTHSFNINIHTNSWNFGRSGFAREYLYSYRILDWMEESGYPFGNAHIGLNQDTMVLAISKLLPYEPEYALRALVRSCFGNVTKRVLTRNSISTIDSQVINHFFDIYLPFLKDSDSENNVSKKSREDICLYMMSLLCIKASEKHVESLFERLVNNLIVDSSRFDKDSFYTVFNSLSLKSTERIADSLFRIPYIEDSDYWLHLPSLPKGHYNFSDKLLKHLIYGLNNKDRKIQSQAFYRVKRLYNEFSDEFREKLQPYIVNWRNQNPQNFPMRESYHYFPYTDGEEIDIKKTIENEIERLDISSMKVTNTSATITTLNNFVSMLLPIIKVADIAHKNIYLSKISDFLEQNEEKLKRNDKNDIFGGLHGFARILLKNFEASIINAKIDGCNEKILGKLAEIIRRYIDYDYDCLYLLALLYQQLDKLEEIRPLVLKYLFEGNSDKSADTLSTLLLLMSKVYDSEVIIRVVSYIEFSQNEDVPSYIYFFQQLVHDNVYPKERYSKLAKMLTVLSDRVKSAPDVSLISDIEFETLRLVNQIIETYHISKEDKAISTWLSINDDIDTFNDVRLKIYK